VLIICKFYNIEYKRLNHMQILLPTKSPGTNPCRYGGTEGQSYFWGCANI
jgi:hypothetical protein